MGSAILGGPNLFDFRFGGVGIRGGGVPRGIETATSPPHCMQVIARPTESGLTDNSAAQCGHFVRLITRLTKVANVLTVSRHKVNAVRLHHTPVEGPTLLNESIFAAVLLSNLVKGH